MARLKTVAESEVGKFIYIGPTLPSGLKSNAVFTGTREKVEEYLQETLQKYPQVRLLIVSTEKLASAKTKVKSRGTLLNKYYNDISSTTYGEGGTI